MEKGPLLAPWVGWAAAGLILAVLAGAFAGLVNVGQSQLSLAQASPARAGQGPASLTATAPSDTGEKAFSMGTAFYDEGFYSAALGFLRQVPPGHPRYAEAQRMARQIEEQLATQRLNAGLSGK